MDSYRLLFKSGLRTNHGYLFREHSEQKGRTHLEALVAHCRWSEYGDGCKWMVVGPDDALLFEVIKVGYLSEKHCASCTCVPQEDYDFVGPCQGLYRLELVNV